ncbi:MAG TPA: glycosyltransferase [Elusimicrobia bacterium]|nr:glycosyltransferase [Elusimicrobiota bacterium]
MEKQSPLVSIITPTFNQSKFLSETIESVLKQDYDNVEYMVINDGSTDNTEEILKKYGDRITWETQKNIGQTPTINKGWKKSKGSILAYINSDDTYYSENVISIIVDYFQKNPDVYILYGNSVYIDENSDELGMYDSYEFNYDKIFSTCSNPIPQPSAFIRKEVLDKVGYLDERIYYAMDLDLWLRAGMHFKIGYIPEKLSTYRLHKDAKSVSSMARSANDVVYIYNKLFRDKDLPKHFIEQKKKIMGRAYLLSAEQYFMGKDWNKSYQAFIEVIKMDISSMGIRCCVKFMFSYILSLIKIFRKNNK